MGGDSCSEGHRFKSWHHILVGHFFTCICCKNCNVFWKDKNKQQRPRVVHLKKLITRRVNLSVTKFNFSYKYVIGWLCRLRGNLACLWSRNKTVFKRKICYAMVLRLRKCPKQNCILQQTEILKLSNTFEMSNSCFCQLLKEMHISSKNRLQHWLVQILPTST